MIKSYYVCLQENISCIPLVAVIMTTANRMHTKFSGKAYIGFYPFRSLPTSRGDCRSQLDPCYFKYHTFKYLSKAKVVNKYYANASVCLYYKRLWNYVYLRLTNFGILRNTIFNMKYYCIRTKKLTALFL